MGKKPMGQPENKGFFGVRCKRKNKCRPLNLSACARRSEISRRLERIPCILLLCLGLGKERWAAGGKKYLLFSRWRENYFTCQSDIPHASHAGSPAPKKEEGKKGHTILISRKEEEEEVSVCPRVEEGNRVEEEEEEESNSFPLSPLGNFSSANNRRARLSFVCSLPLSSPSDFAGEEEKK